MATIQTATTRGATFADLYQRVVGNIEQVIQGKRDVIELMLLCLVSEGHLLLEDVPGVGKTSLAKSLAASIEASFGRVQFTPDLLPTDVVGLTVWNRNEGTFDFRAGPVFNNVVLADEINRASPKTQAALLEAMAEVQVTVDGATYPLDPAVHGHRHAEPDRARGHLPAARVAARPVPHAGLGGLPVARRRDADPRHPRRPRRLPRHRPGRLGRAHRRHGRRRPGRPHGPRPQGLPHRPRPGHAPHAQPGARHVAPGHARLQRVAKARAASQGRGYVTPDDVKALAVPVLAHRLLVTPEAQLQGLSAADVLADVLRAVPVPGGQ